MQLPANKSSESLKMLPEDFAPGLNHIVIGKGRKYYTHSGNAKLRKVVNQSLSEYAIANTKAKKSAIIANVVEQIRKTSTYGGFVRQDKTSRRWIVAGDYLAREKTSQAFRDALHENYRSSKENRMKNKRRLQEKEASLAAFQMHNTTATAFQTTMQDFKVGGQRPGSFEGGLSLLQELQTGLQSAAGFQAAAAGPLMAAAAAHQAPESNLIPAGLNFADQELYRRLALLSNVDDRDANPFEPTPIVAGLQTQDPLALWKSSQDALGQMNTSAWQMLM